MIKRERDFILGDLKTTKNEIGAVARGRSRCSRQTAISQTVSGELRYSNDRV